MLQAQHQDWRRPTAELHASGERDLTETEGHFRPLIRQLIRKTYVQKDRKMSTLVYEIISRQKEMVFAPATPEHYILSAGTPFDTAELVSNRNWMLHFIDHTNRRVAFALMPDGVDLGAAPFVYAMQHDMAQRLVFVPFETFLTLADQLPSPSNVVFVFSIGRCGSTLLSKIFGEVPGVWGLSEPDPYSQINHHRHDYDLNTRVDLIRATTRFLFRPPGQDVTTFVAKFRSYSTFDMEPYFLAFPNARNIFLWREPKSWANSFYMLAQMLGSEQDRNTRAFLDFRWKVQTAEAPPALYARFDDLTLERSRDVPILVALWVASMETYLAARDNGAPLEAFSYHQLNDNREATVTRLLAACGLSPTHLPAALKAYERDSQEDSIISGMRNSMPLSDAQRAEISGLLAGHPSLNLL